MYFPLSLRLTFFYTLILVVALWFFGYIVYTQAEQNAYQSLRDTLRDKATNLSITKDIFGASSPITLSSVNALGQGGVGIEILALDSVDNVKVVATNVGTPETTDRLQTVVTGLGESPPQGWDPQAVQQAMKETASSPYSKVIYQGQAILVYTKLSSLPGNVIQVAHTTQDIEQALANLRTTLFNGALLVFLLALLGSLFISRGILSAVYRMSNAARKISVSKNFGQRIPEKNLLGRDELAALATTFNQMLASLEEAYQRQQRFVADASHELRAPITSIRCNLDLLAKAPDLPTEEVQGALSDARAEAERMGRLVNDLLILAHNDETQQLDKHATINTEDSKYRLRQPSHKVDLDSLLLDVFRQYRPGEESGPEGPNLRGPRLLLQDITPAQVDGDADQLKQALVALVDNALKYTPHEGTVSLALNTTEDYALVQVRDNGIGITPEDLPHIFERFYRANRVRPRDRGGSGLGLSITQSIIQAHHGRIEVESTLGKGSTFIVKMPLAR